MYGYAVPYNANTLHDIASITKGVVALLIGIALDRGWLSDLDAPIMSFFPEYADLRTPEKDPGESGEETYRAISSARKSSSHPAALRLSRKEAFPGAFRIRF